MILKLIGTDHAVKKGMRVRAVSGKFKGKMIRVDRVIEPCSAYPRGALIANYKDTNGKAAPYIYFHETIAAEWVKSYD
jgi:hypothetical protein